MRAECSFLARASVESAKAKQLLKVHPKYNQHYLEPNLLFKNRQSLLILLFQYLFFKILDFEICFIVSFKIICCQMKEIKDLYSINSPVLYYALFGNFWQTPE